MKAFLSAIFLVIAASLSLHAQSNQLVGTLGSLNIVAKTNIMMTLQIVAPTRRTINGVLISDDTLTNTTDMAGNFAYTNVAYGKYRLAAADFNNTYWTLYVGTNTLGLVPIASLITNATAVPPNPGTNYYTQAQINALLAYVLAPTNLVPWQLSVTNLNTNGVGNAFAPGAVATWNGSSATWSNLPPGSGGGETVAQGSNVTVSVSGSTATVSAVVGHAEVTAATSAAVTAAATSAAGLYLPLAATNTMSIGGNAATASYAPINATNGGVIFRMDSFGNVLISNSVTFSSFTIDTNQNVFGNNFLGLFSGSGAGLASISAGALIGTINNARIVGLTSNNIDANTTALFTNGPNAAQIAAAGGNTNNASTFTSGTVPLARLSGITSNNIDANTTALFTNGPNAAQITAGGGLLSSWTNTGSIGGASVTTATATNVVSGISITNANLAGTVTGNVNTNNASNLTSGTVPLAQLSGITSNQLDAATWYEATNLNGGNATKATNDSFGNKINLNPTNVATYTYSYSGLPTLASLYNFYYADPSNNCLVGFGSGGWQNGGATFAMGGFRNTGVGMNVLQDMSLGNDNTAIGYESIWNLEFGSNNVAVGSQTGGEMVDQSSDNTLIGFSSAFNANDTLGLLLLGNTFVGSKSAYNFVAGTNNTAIGYRAGSAWVNTSNNIAIGNVGVSGDSGTIRIGTPGVQTSTFIAGVINANGPGLTNLQSAVIPGPGPMLTTNPVTGQLAPTYNGASLTNLSASAIYTNGSYNGVLIDATTPYQRFVTNASYTITGFSGLSTVHYQHELSQSVSNSSGSAIVVTMPVGTPIGAVTTNSLTIPGGKRARIFFDIVPGAETNYINCLSQ